jgi:hypothetical protein
MAAKAVAPSAGPDILTSVDDSELIKAMKQRCQAIERPVGPAGTDL